MAKQIIVTQNNYGILLETQFIDDAKNPIDLTGYSVSVEFEYQEKCFDVLDATIINAEEGRVGVILEQKHTAEIGLYKTQWSVVDDDENVTAQEDIYYFVKKEVGTEEEKEEPGTNIDVSGIADKFKELDETLLEHGEKLTEIVEARGGENSLGDRLDNIDSQLDDIDKEITLYNDNNMINMKIFGAKGDGVSDDTEAIGNCLTYCVENEKTMYFPNGVYCVSHGFLPVPSKDHALKNNLVSIVGESHLGVIFKRIGTSEDPYIFDFKWCNKVYAENLSSPDFSFNTLDNDTYWQGNEAWALALREKDFYLKNLIYTGDGGATSYYTYINSPCPKNYTRYADGNYAKYPLEITSGSGYNAININNFATNEDGSIGEPQDNSAIGIVDRVNNSTGTIFIDMIGNRSFERYVNRNATICSEVRPQTVWEIHRNGHIAIGCSVNEQDPVAPGWGAIKIRDNSPKIELFDANNNNEKLTIGQVKQDWGQEFYIKFGNVGLTMVKDNASGNVLFNGFRWGGISGGLKINIGDNPVESGIVLNRGSINAPLTLDSNGDLRFGGNHQSVAEEYSRVYCVHGAESYFRPKLANHWKDIGYMFFDTDLNKPIWWNGTKWVDSTGKGV